MQTADRIYFAVPDHYTIGREFDTYAEAERYAHTKIHEIDGCPGSFTRAFVDVRVANARGDESIHRVEVKMFRLDDALAARA